MNCPKFLLYPLGLLVVGAGIVWASSTTLTTYYPAPTGNYNQITSNYVSIGTSIMGQPLIVMNGNVGVGSTAPAGLLDVEGAHPILLNGLANAAGNVGIGTTNPKELLDVYGIAVIGNNIAAAPSTTVTASGALILRGSTSNANIQVQDGSGRVNYLWNATAGGGTYLVSSEPADRFLETTNGTTGADFQFYTAPSGTAGGAITWTQMGDINGQTDVWFSPRGTSSDFYISNLGNVGIGTTAPGALLQVDSLADASPATYTGSLKISSATATSLASVGGIELLVAGNGYSTKIQGLSASGSALAFARRNNSTAWTESMRIDANGNVGIGSAAPAGLLDVEGAHPILLNGLNATGGNVGIGTTNPVALIHAVEGTSINPSLTYGSSAAYIFNSAGVDLAMGTLTTAPWTSWIQSRIWNSAANPISLNPLGGNVGIGTTTPSSILHIEGGTSSDQLQLSQGGASYMYKIGRNTTTGNLDFNGTQTGSIGYTFSGGNVGIGITNPAAPLQIGSTVTLGQNPVGGTDEFDIHNTTGNTYMFGYSTGSTSVSLGAYNGGYAPFYLYGNPVIMNAGNVGIGSTMPTQVLNVVGNILATGTVTANSDRRLKQNIAPLTGTLSKLDQLRGVSFEWNRLAIPMRHKEGEKGIGMIAQELQKVYPELVVGSKKDYFSIDYGKFTAVLLQSIKELKSQVNAMQDQINALQRKVKTLEKQK